MKNKLPWILFNNRLYVNFCITPQLKIFLTFDPRVFRHIQKTFNRPGFKWKKQRPARIISALGIKHSMFFFHCLGLYAIDSQPVQTKTSINPPIFSWGILSSCFGMPPTELNPSVSPTRFNWMPMLFSYAVSFIYNAFLKPFCCSTSLNQKTLWTNVLCIISITSLDSSFWFSVSTSKPSFAIKSPQRIRRLNSLWYSIFIFIILYLSVLNNGAPVRNTGALTNNNWS